MTQRIAQQASPSRMRLAAFTSIGEEGRAELVESRIMQAISAGAFSEGERLPSETELSQLLGVALVTVREALGMLRYRGLIETRRGRNGGSFVRTSHGAIEADNARALMNMSRGALADLGVHYEAVSAACADFACRRATPEELDQVEEKLSDISEPSAREWRRLVTEIQLQLAALSQSVRLTNDHVRLQTELTPFLALQDPDVQARETILGALFAQVSALRAGDVMAARAAVKARVNSSMRWLIGFREQLLEAENGGSFVSILDSRSK